MKPETTLLQRGAYSPRVAARIAKIRYQSFQAWAKANLLKASPFRVTSKTTENTYSYQDLLLIRLIVRLKNSGAKPREIRTALDTLTYLSGTDDAWMRSAIAVQGSVVVAILHDRPEVNPIAASRGPQKGLHIVFFPELLKELKEELVPPDRFPFIDVDPAVLGGLPTIKGTRISTRAVMSVLRSGGEPLAAYPSLTEAQVSNAEQYERFLEDAA